MGTTLSTLSPAPGTTKRRKRVGRGRGSHRGKTSTRGVKGQKSRTGHHGARLGFEGGQMPMSRRLPKRGFKNLFRKEVVAINVGLLASQFDGEVGVEQMRAAGLIPRSADLVKVLGEGKVDKPLVVRAHRFSQSAAEKLAAAGGKAEPIVVIADSQKADSGAVESA
jgi:large subunit ribosomal protein L15